MPNPNAQPELGRILVDTYQITTKSSSVDKWEQKVDNFNDKLSKNYSALTDTYNTNKDILTGITTALTSISPQTIEDAISTFSTTANAMMDFLEALSSVHPIVYGVFIAFKAVVKMDIGRRENNQKVKALQVQMQDTVCVLIQLRDVRDPEDIYQGIHIKDRIGPLLENIAKSIKKCSSDCDAYLKKGLLSRMVKYKKYENRLAGWATTFSEHKISLKEALAVRTASDVHHIKQEIAEEKKMLKTMQTTMAEILHKLDTTQAKDVTQWVSANGGIRACIERDDLLAKLISKTGESLSSVTQRSRVKGNEDLAAARKALREELAEDVGEVFEKHFAGFEAKMAFQEQQIEELRADIVSRLPQGSYFKIRDKHLQALWREMHWKGSVKARYFVLALRDYFMGQFNERSTSTSPTATPRRLADGLPPLDPPTPESDTAGNDSPIVDQGDLWALDYLNVSQLRPILEVIDDDGTGFISIKEANEFATEKPAGWTLLHWLAFWARGWHQSLSKYKNQIYLLVQEMHRDLENVRQANRCMIDWYLDDDAFRTIEQLLRSTKLPDENEPLHPELVRMTNSYVKKEEERLERNLEKIKYNLDFPARVELITGKGRIERYVYPLLFLILRHHARIVKTACHHVLDEDEMVYWSESLSSIATLLKNRAENVVAIYKQSYADVKVRLENFAFGMYRLIWESPESWKPINNSFASWIDTSNERDDSPLVEYHCEDTGLLHYGNHDTFSYKFLDPDTEPFEINSGTPQNSSDFEGYWSGHCFEIDADGNQTSTKGLITVHITSVEDGGMKGVIESCLGIGEVSGSILGTKESGHQTITLVLTDDVGSNSIYHLIGRFDPAKGVIEGRYHVEGEDDGDFAGYGENETESEAGEGEGTHRHEHTDRHQDSLNPNNGKLEARLPIESVEEHSEINSHSGDCSSIGDLPETLTFILRRTPPDLYRFRYPDVTRNAVIAKARWAFACKAVLYCVQKKRWSWTFLKERIRELKRMLHLRAIAWRQDDDMAPHVSLAPHEKEELTVLDRSMAPAITGLCRALIEHYGSREVCLFMLECEICERTILHPGFKCLQCITPDFASAINLCPDCVDLPISYDNFIHDNSHSMLKMPVVLHDYRLSFLVRESRALVDRIKPGLREQEKHKSRPDVVRAKAKPSKYFCVLCKEPVTALCYVCAECPHETFICGECDMKGTSEVPSHTKGRPHPHKMTHITIRISNTDEEEFEKEVTDVTIKRLEGMEEELKNRVDFLDERLNGLEEKIAEHFKALLKQLGRV